MTKQPNSEQPQNSKGTVPVLIEMRMETTSDKSRALRTVEEIGVEGLKLDDSFPPVEFSQETRVASTRGDPDETTFVIRAEIPENKIKELESHPKVVKVWKDTPIAPFSCPIDPCDCTFGNPAIGNLDAVIKYLGVDKIWADGKKGSGIVIGIVDGGITAIGRNPQGDEVAKISRVIGGWPDDWGTTAAAWKDHGNMTSTDALTIAPEAEIYDIRISSSSMGNTIAKAILGYEWAIKQHRTNGTPQILSNSWGIYQQSWDNEYATDPNHPFTKEVVKALNEGLIVLFAAGNCGGTCPDTRCGSDNGPGKGIWGANSHPRVITVGAVNLKEQFVGYSSQGPGALDSNKPDICAITHFAGYFPTLNSSRPSDGGTSAATPITAGVVALLKGMKSSLTQDDAKNALKSTAKDIGPPGWDNHSGSGIINGKAVYDLIRILASAPTSMSKQQKGSNGPEVTSLQEILKIKGFDPGVVDGKFGPKTEAAVKQFQSAKGLVVDGIVGPKTWSALLS
jgi:serine protease AprX